MTACPKPRPSDREEAEWQSAIRMSGIGGVLWALISLLVKRGIFTPEEIRDAVQAQAGITHYSGNARDDFYT